MELRKERRECTLSSIPKELRCEQHANAKIDKTVRGTSGQRVERPNAKWHGCTCQTYSWGSLISARTRTAQLCLAGHNPQNANRCKISGE